MKCYDKEHVVNNKQKSKTTVASCITKWDIQS